LKIITSPNGCQKGFKQNQLEIMAKGQQGITSLCPTNVVMPHTELL